MPPQSGATAGSGAAYSPRFALSHSLPANRFTISNYTRLKETAANEVGVVAPTENLQGWDGVWLRLIVSRPRRSLIRAGGALRGCEPPGRSATPAAVRVP